MLLCVSPSLYSSIYPFSFLPPSFSVVHPSIPSPASRPPSLLSPFPFPSSVRRSPCRPILPICELRPRPPRLPSPVSLSVVSLCLSSLFVSLFHPFPHVTVPFFVPLASLPAFYSPFASVVPLFPSILRLSVSLFLHFSLSLLLFFTLFLRSTLPPIFIPLRRYFELSFSFPSISLSVSGNLH